jgi:hypothetical protein
VPAEPSELEIRPWMRLASWGYFLLVLLLYGSVAAGFVLESRLAVFVALAAFTATLTVHLVVSILEYRRTMRREWPKVEPIADDDDWDAA